MKAKLSITRTVDKSGVSERLSNRIQYFGKSVSVPVKIPMLSNDKVAHRNFIKGI